MKSFKALCFLKLYSILWKMSFGFPLCSTFTKSQFGVNLQSGFRIWIVFGCKSVALLVYKKDGLRATLLFSSVLRLFQNAVSCL